MNTSMGSRLLDYVDADGYGCPTENDPMKQYANRVIEIFVERCADHEEDPNRLWHYLTNPEGTLRSMYQRHIGVPEAAEQLRYRAANRIRTMSPPVRT